MCCTDSTVHIMSYLNDGWLSTFVKPKQSLIPEYCHYTVDQSTVVLNLSKLMPSNFKSLNLQLAFQLNYQSNSCPAQFGLSKLYYRMNAN